MASIDEKFSGGELLSVAFESNEGTVGHSTETSKSPMDASLTRTPDSSSSSSSREQKKEKKKKSSSWYNVLNPSYKSRADDFKRIFKDLPDAERLIVDYSCALQKDILVHGRLYISQNFLCFYANIFRWETSLIIRCKDITSISKEKTALVIPNAIQICTSVPERHFFASFGSREKAYLMLFRVWQNALLNQPMAPQELWQWIHTNYGDDLGLTSDDDDYVSPLSNADEDCQLVNGELAFVDKRRVDSRPVDSPGKEQQDVVISCCPNITSSLTCQSADMNALFASGGHHQNADDWKEGSAGGATTADAEMCAPTELKHRRVGSAASAASVSSVDAPLTDELLVTSRKHYPAPKPPIEDPALNGADGASGCSESESEVLGEICCPCEGHEGREVLNTVLPFSVDQLFTIMFSNSKFLKEFHAMRKTTDVVHSAWHDHEDGKMRQVTYTLQVNLGMTVKAVQTTETQIMRKCSNPGLFYIIEVDAITPGLPYGDTFYTHHRHCITRVSSEECRLMTHSEIKYKKSVWGLMKSFIERNAWSGLTEFYKDLEGNLFKEASNMAPLSMKPKRVRRKHRPVEGEAKLEMSRGVTEVPSSQCWRIPPTASINDTAKMNAATGVLIPLTLVILVLLLILNALLYYKLWLLETGNFGQQFVSNYYVDPDMLKKPRSNDEWITLIREQEILHGTEVNKWKEVIDTVILLLQETEESLVTLKHNIQLYGFRDRSELRSRR